MVNKKGIVFAVFLLVFLLICQVSALNINVTTTDKVPTVISELKDPAIFNLAVDNHGSGENIEVYSLVGVSFEPKDTFYLGPGMSNFDVRAYPGESIRNTEGNYAFEYQIKGEGSDIFKGQLTIKIVKLKNVLSIDTQGINYGDDKAVIKVRNVQNVPIENATLDIESVFFKGTRQLSLAPFESATITLPVNAGEVKDLAAGPYVVSSNLQVNGVKAKIESNVNYRERQKVTTETTGSGLILRSTSITDKNEGNLAVTDKIEVTKNILTRLFTTFSAEPLVTERNGLLVNYRWEKDLAPGASWTVNVRTNYTLPFALIILIIFSAGAVYIYSRTAVVLQKRCSFVKTRGGEFALKVTLHLKARKAVDDIEISDRIPMATKLYDKAGMPHKFDERMGKLHWKVDRLNAGEERIFSYIIYSTLRIVGRLELPPASAHFKKEGKSTYVHSNRTYFISDVQARY